MQGITFSSLSELSLSTWHTSIRDEAWPPFPLVPNGNAEDPYLRALGHLASTASNLKTLLLIGPVVICPEFFSRFPTFPALTDFHLDFATETADGQWFFIRDEELEKRMDEEDDEEEDEEEESESESDSEPVPWIKFTDPDDKEGPLEHRDWGNPPRFRTLPNPETINTLLLGAAQFVQTTPKLQKFILRNKTSSGIGEQPLTMMYAYMTRNLQIWYMKPGVPRSEGPGFLVNIKDEPKYLGYPRLYWRADEWRPDDDVAKAWNKATEPDTKVFFLKEDRFDPWADDPIYEGDLDEVLVK